MTVAAAAVAAATPAASAAMLGGSKAHAQMSITVIAAYRSINIHQQPAMQHASASEQGPRRAQPMRTTRPGNEARRLSLRRGAWPAPQLPFAFRDFAGLLRLPGGMRRLPTILKRLALCRAQFGHLGPATIIPVPARCTSRGERSIPHSLMLELRWSPSGFVQASSRLRALRTLSDAIQTP